MELFKKDQTDPPADDDKKADKEAVDKEPKVPVDPATGEPYKAGEVPLGSNEPVGGKFVGAEATRFDCERERAETAARESEERAAAERKRLENANKARAKAEKEAAPKAKK